MKNNDILELFPTEKENRDTFTFKEGDVSLEVKLDDNETWLTQKQIAVLYDIDFKTVSKHFINIFKEGELVEKEVCKHLPIKSNDNNEKVRLNEKEPMFSSDKNIGGICPKGTFSKPSDFKTALHYNLEGIIAIGFRVTSNRGNKFRIWSNKILKEYLTKGYAINKPVLEKDPKKIVKLHEEAQVLRLHEKSVYRHVTDLAKGLVKEYGVNPKTDRKYFVRLQNTLYYAVNEMTAGRIKYDRLDKHDDTLGLVTWSDGDIKKKHLDIAKNYLNEKELLYLAKLVELVKFAVDEIKIKISWKEFINKFEKAIDGVNRSIFDGDYSNDPKKMEFNKKRDMAYKYYSNKRIMA